MVIRAEVPRRPCPALALCSLDKAQLWRPRRNFLLRRNFNVAPTVKYCVYLCFNCAYGCLIASISIDATNGRN
jgi:hypothetical protein